MLRRLVVLPAVAACLVALLVAPASASTTTPLPCGDFVEVTGPVNYRVTNDSCGVIFTGNGRAASVTIDLAGHTLWVTASDVSVSLSNGTVGFGKLGPRSIDHGALTLSKVHVISGFTADVAPVNIRRSVIDGAIRCHQCHLTADHTIFRGNVTTLTSTTSITSSLVVGGIRLEGAEIASPDIRGELVGNVITGSAGAGVDITDGGSAMMTVARNLIVGNAGDGIALGPSAIATTGVSTFARNTVVGNGGHGFNLEPDLPSQVVDGGRNRAHANALDPQCIGVTCS